MNDRNGNHSPQPIEVLLVDDDEADVKLTLRALRQNRVLNNIQVVRDGVEAMQFLHRKEEFADAPRPDLILLDLNMPRMDGREVLREIKSNPDLAKIPVVVLTTSNADEDIDHSYAAHANSFVTKPVDMEQFKKAILSVKDYWFAVVALPTNSQ